jgi:hypothetical protein
MFRGLMKYGEEGMGKEPAVAITKTKLSFKTVGYFSLGSK